MSRFKMVMFAVGGLALYLQSLLETAGVDPIASPLPPLPEFPSSTLIRNITGKVEILGRDELVGPESLVSSKDFLFAALGNGQIARLEHAPGDELKWNYLSLTPTTPDAPCEFSPSDRAETEQRCGRPLGMKIVKRSTVDPNFTPSTSDSGVDGTPKEDNDEDVLVVADAYRGLLMVTNIYAQNVKQVTVTTLATKANKDPPEYHFQLLNALVQAPDGSIYMTETSQRFQRRRIFYAALDGRKTGRLLRYSKQDGVEVMVDRGLFMPNGLTLSHDKGSLWIVCSVSIHRFSLLLQRMVSPSYVPVLPGTGDNIDAMDHLPSGEPRKCYWAGLGSKYTQPFSLLHWLSDKPFFKSILVALVPYHMIVDFIPKWSVLAVYDDKGDLIEMYKDDSLAFPWISEGESFGGYLYLGSWYNPFLARVKMGGKVTATSRTS